MTKNLTVNSDSLTTFSYRDQWRHDTMAGSRQDGEPEIRSYGKHVVWAALPWSWL